MKNIFDKFSLIAFSIIIFGIYHLFQYIKFTSKAIMFLHTYGLKSFSSYHGSILILLALLSNVVAICAIIAGIAILKRKLWGKKLLIFTIAGFFLHNFCLFMFALKNSIDVPTIYFVLVAVYIVIVFRAIQNDDFERIKNKKDRKE